MCMNNSPAQLIPVNSLEDRKKYFSRNLNRLLVERNFSQNDLAQYIGVSKQVVSQYIHGKSLPKPETLIAIANFFKVQETWLLGVKELTDNNVEHLIPVVDLKKMTKQSFESFENEFLSKYSIVEIKYLNQIFRVFISLFHLNYEGVSKVLTYARDLGNTRTHVANSAHSFKHSKYK